MRRGTTKSTEGASAPSLPKKPGPAKGWKQKAEAAHVAAQQALSRLNQPIQVAQAPQAPAPVAAVDRRPLGSVNVDSLSGDELRNYGRRAGVRELDCQNLSEDRLRQNIKMFIANHFELLTED